MPTLYWDFFGPDAAPTAEHHRRHLAEFLARAGLPIETPTGTLVVEPGHVASWCAVPEAARATVERALRPRRIEPQGRPEDLD